VPAADVSMGSIVEPLAPTLNACPEHAASAANPNIAEPKTMVS